MPTQQAEQGQVGGSTQQQWTCHVCTFPNKAQPSARSCAIMCFVPALGRNSTVIDSSKCHKFSVCNKVLH